MGEELSQEFQKDSVELGKITSNFLGEFYPAYFETDDSVKNMEKEDSLSFFKNQFIFYKISSCSISDVDDMASFFANKLQKIFSAAYAIRRDICYGIVSHDNKTALVIGIRSTSDSDEIKTIIEGLLPGLKLELYANEMKEEYENRKQASAGNETYYGSISGIPLREKEPQKGQGDFSALMRSLNGQNYTVLVLCTPVNEQMIQTKIDQVITIHDECYAISKRTLSIQNGSTNSTSTAENHNKSTNRGKTKQNGINVNGAAGGLLGGVTAGAIAGSVVPGIGTVAGAVGGGLLGLIAGKQITFSKGQSTTEGETLSDGYSNAVTNAISENQSVSVETQNSFATELVNFSDAELKRLKVGRNIGLWKSFVSFSSDNEAVSNIIKGFLYSEIASNSEVTFPPTVFLYKDTKNEGMRYSNELLIPKGFFDNTASTHLENIMTSEELCGICTIPQENTVGFEIRKGKSFPLSYEPHINEKRIGSICDFDRPIHNISFGISDEDINRHVFVCGITGSGKTRTVKKILENTDKPFLVIEPAKKEYRNLNSVKRIYTLGRPEVNCPRINPFYIMPGINPQQHIDLLKDLFSTSFAFYGPMPYIFEKCLNRIYENKGWNLTFGFHPLLSNKGDTDTLFDEEILEKCYKEASHKYLFPTMSDLKNEIEKYIDTELDYEGEVKGNIRSAILSRIDSLCVGAKGYMFNTNQYLDIKDLLNTNSVLELEGLSDDSDKAFSLGLLIIFINEFRQISKETDLSVGLKHTLVIEEAHRLLKNVATERSEDLGNPKGKAVEHFTNLLAEMRSYGQGVIVAEQIPSKLAPDVIKNTSTKIIHRIDARDDQEVVANTIGLKSEDALFLGNSKTRYALCHKEGMSQPVTVYMDQEEDTNNIKDIKIYKDYGKNNVEKVNEYIMMSSLKEDIQIVSIQLLVSIMYLEDIDEAITRAIDRIDELIYEKNIVLVSNIEARKRCIRITITNVIASLLMQGVFSNGQLASNNLIEAIKNVILQPNKEMLTKAKSELQSFYSKEPANKAVEIVGELWSGEFAKGTDVSKKVNDYILIPDKEFGRKVNVFLEGGAGHEYS